MISIIIIIQMKSSVHAFFRVMFNFDKYSRVNDAWVFYWRYFVVVYSHTPPAAGCTSTVPEYIDPPLPHGVACSQTMMLSLFLNNFLVCIFNLLDLYWFGL
jgi:hypothetical protein